MFSDTEAQWLYYSEQGRFKEHNRPKKKWVRDQLKSKKLDALELHPQIIESYSDE